MSPTRAIGWQRVARRIRSLVWGRDCACLLLGLALTGLATAEVAHLATGEYAPFVSESEPGKGVTAAIVQAALSAANVSTEMSFLPWKRGYVDTESTRYDATFPYLRTPEREQVFLYSDVIFFDYFDVFIRAGSERPKSWRGLRLCIPAGYDQSQIASFIDQNQLAIEIPPEIRNCFQMLKAGRVEGIWVSELVAAATSRELFGKEKIAVPLNLNLVGKVGYYLIVSRKRPDAQRWLDRFNVGLKAIRANGSYERIVTGYSGN